ncbi:hypothetical protein [Streptomyces sp. NPDC047453]|uniref:hypothetical protein n=1 Tax=Streptomyces sp. NPDC047453 TaxID=3154812 RepID=UPI0033EB1CA5
MCQEPNASRHPLRTLRPAARQADRKQLQRGLSIHRGRARPWPGIATQEQLAFLILALGEVFRRGTKLRADTEGLV